MQARPKPRTGQSKAHRKAKEKKEKRYSGNATQTKHKAGQTKYKAKTNWPPGGGVELMDMRSKLGEWLTGDSLHALGDRYDGVVERVEDQQIRNKFTTKLAAQTVMVFQDGKQLVLNRKMIQILIGRWGATSEDWIGQQLAVACRPSERRDAKTGAPMWERYLPDEDGVE